MSLLVFSVGCVLYDLVLGFGQLEDIGDNTVQHFLDLFRLKVITHS